MEAARKFSLSVILPAAAVTARTPHIFKLAPVLTGLDEGTLVDVIV